MKLNYKTKKTLSQALSIVLVCLVGFGAVMGLSALSKKLDEETKIIYPTFEVGGINSEGKGDKELTGSIYTKESFECKGLEIRLDFDANVKYKVYYYNDLDTLLGTSQEYDESMKLSVPANATHARVVVTPIWNKDIAKEDRVCHWYDVTKYSSQLEITVLKEQDDKSGLVSLFDVSSIDLNTDMTAYTNTSNPFMLQDNTKLNGQTIKRIGVPVSSVADYTTETVFTVYVVKGNTTESTIVETIELVAEANTFNSNTVNDWHYFDVNIELGENETLAFYGDTDTIIPMYSNAYLEEFGGFYTMAGTAGGSFIDASSIFFDIWVEQE